MRIKCPYCGERALEEFTYRGDAAEAWTEYVYLRDNPAGPHKEHWHHSAGCHSWLVVTRDTRTHEIVAVEFAGNGEGT